MWVSGAVDTKMCLFVYFLTRGQFNFFLLLRYMCSALQLFVMSHFTVKDMSPMQVDSQCLKKSFFLSPSLLVLNVITLLWQLYTVFHYENRLCLLFYFCYCIMQRCQLFAQPKAHNSCLSHHPCSPAAKHKYTITPKCPYQLYDRLAAIKLFTCLYQLKMSKQFLPVYCKKWLIYQYVCSLFILSIVVSINSFFLY